MKNIATNRSLFQIITHILLRVDPCDLTRKIDMLLFYIKKTNTFMNLISCFQDKG